MKSNTGEKQTEFLNATGAGQLLGIGAFGVIGLARRGRLPYLKDSGGRKIYRRIDVMKLVEEREAARRAK
jgi:hypothetical protein